MCGSGGYFQPKETKKGVPVWRITNDEKHIVFYGDDTECSRSSTWCRQHCYMAIKPPIFEMKPKYELEDFNPKNNSIFKKDLIKSKFVTLFASGLLPDVFRTFDTEWEIRSIAEWNPKQIFRFFIRTPFNTDKTFPANVRVIFSADASTTADDLDWAITSKHVNFVAIIDHIDNRIVDEYVTKRITNILRCAECRDEYKCFNATLKKYLVLQYITLE